MRHTAAGAGAPIVPQPLRAVGDVLSLKGIVPHSVPGFVRQELTRLMHPFAQGYISMPPRPVTPGALVLASFGVGAGSPNMTVLASLRVEKDGRRWLHVSASFPNRTPTWDEMCQVKDLFIGADRVAIQVHPRGEEHFSFHEHCLHLFACLDGDALPDFRDEDGRV